MKRNLKMSVIAALAGVMCCATSIPATPFAVYSLTASAASAGQTLTVGNGMSQHKEDNVDGYSYEIWIDQTGGSGSMTLGSGGSFNTEWSAQVSAGNFLARRGRNYDASKKATQYGNIVMDYAADYSASAQGNSRLCVYGWFKDPLVEYYIIEDWVNWCPSGNGSTVTIDGAQYDIFQLDHTGPTILGNTQTFKQYFSVRKQKRTSGTITVSDHFKAWQNAGWNIGNLTEVALNVEGWESSGRANVSKLTIGDGGGQPAQNNDWNQNQNQNNDWNQNQNQNNDWNQNQNNGWDWNNWNQNNDWNNQNNNQNNGWDWNNQNQNNDWNNQNQNNGWDWNNWNQNNDWNNQNNNNNWNQNNDWNNQNNNWNQNNDWNSWNWNNNDWNNQNNNWNQNNDWNNQNNNWNQNNDWNNQNNWNQNNDWNNQNNNWNQNNDWNNQNNNWNQNNDWNSWNWNNNDWNNQNNNWNQNNDWNNQNQNNGWDWNNQNNNWNQNNDWNNQNQNQNNGWDWNNQNQNNNWDWNNWNQNNDWNNQNQNQNNGWDWNNQNQNNDWNSWNQNNDWNNQNNNNQNQNGGGVDPSKPMIAISFDDGASPQTGNRIVSALAKNGFHATFFYVGDWIRDANGEQEIRNAYAQGMEIANHTTTHPYLTQLGSAQIRSEFDNTHAKLKQIIGAEPSKLMRLPYLDSNGTVTSTLNDVALISCALDTQDWNGHSKDQIVNDIKGWVTSGQGNGAIVLCHETYDSTASAMEEVLPWIKSQGWQVVTISEMFAAKGKQLNGGTVYTRV